MADMMIMLDLTIDWKRVIDTLPKGVVVIDTGGRIRHVNPAFEFLTGYGAIELMGNACTMLECSGCEPWYGEKGFRCMLFSAGENLKPTVCRIDSKMGHRLKVYRQASLLRDAKGITVGAVETIWDYSPSGSAWGCTRGISCWGSSATGNGCRVR